MLFSVLLSVLLLWSVMSEAGSSSPNVLGSHVRKISSHTLDGEPLQVLMDVPSVKHCNRQCLQHQQAGCVAYHWHSTSKTCRLHNSTSRLTKIDTAHTVGLMINQRSMFDFTDMANDCAEILSLLPESESGNYVITLPETLQAKHVWCDMETDGGGWTVFLKRQDGSQYFFKKWKHYKSGFGKVDNEFWLGLDILHELTSSKVYQLRADMSDFNGLSAHALYASIHVANRTDKFILTMGEFLGGDAGDALTPLNGTMFSTKDNDNDKNSGNCAQMKKGGFWFNSCGRSNPTGTYYEGGIIAGNGIYWCSWAQHDDSYSLKTMSLKIRPVTGTD